MSGKSETQFQPTASLTRAELATILLNTLSDFKTDYSGKGKVFNDVRGNDDFAEAVAFVSSHNLMVGYPDGTFKPDRAITRAEMAKVASMFHSYTNAAPRVLNASDVKSIAWYYPYVKTFYNRGYMTLSNESLFYPERELTRAEAASILCAMFSRCAAVALPNRFADVDPSVSDHYAASVVDASTTYTN